MKLKCWHKRVSNIFAIWPHTPSSTTWNSNIPNQSELLGSKTLPIIWYSEKLENITVWKTGLLLSSVRCKTPTLLDPSERSNLNHWTTHVSITTATYIPDNRFCQNEVNRAGASPPPPEDRNRSSFQNGVFSCYLLSIKPGLMYVSCMYIAVVTLTQVVQCLKLTLLRDPME
jgi:hypothetical protein